MTDLPALPDNSALPDYLRGLGETKIAETGRAGLQVRSPPYVSIQGGAFTLVDAGGNKVPWPLPYIDCVIVDVSPVMSRVFWGVDEHGYVTSFDPMAQAYGPPICFSDNGVGASARAPKPQATRCDGCQWSVWGSAISRRDNQGIPACSSMKKLGLFIHGATPEGKEWPFLLRVPIMSREDLDRYLVSFVGHQFDVNRVWTRISFVHGLQGRITFDTTYTFDKRYSFIDPTTAAITKRIMDARMTDELVGRNDVVWQGPAMIASTPTPALTQPSNPSTPGGGTLPPTAAPPPTAPAAPPVGLPTPPAAGAPPPAQAAPGAPQGRGRGRPKKADGQVPAVVPPPAPVAPAGAAPMPPPPPTPAASGLPAPPSFAMPPAPPGTVQAPVQGTVAPPPTAPFGVVTNPPGPPNEMQAALSRTFGV